jgi:hypothetical protein
MGATMPSSEHSLPGANRPDLADLPDRPLTVPLLIRGSFDNGLVVACCAVAVVATGVGVLILRDGDLMAASSVFTLAAVAGAPALFMGLWLRRHREWLEVTSAGFVLTDRGGRRVYTDDQVIALAQQASIGAEGNLKRRLVLEIATDEPEHIDCRYGVPAGQADQLAGFVARLVNAVAERADRDLDQGGKLRGEGWSLTATCLRRGREAHPLDRLSWVGFYDGHLCLWNGDDERPFLRLPDGSRNVHALGEVLTRRLRRRPDFDRPPPGLPLGRLLLERRSWGFWLGVGVGVLGALGALLLWLFALRLTPYERPPLLGVAVACCCLMIGGVVTAWCGRFGWLRFFERGVSQTGRMGVRQFLYEEIGELIWKKNELLIVKPLPGLERPAIRFRNVNGKFDAQLGEMRDRACEPLAERWIERLAHAPVTWTPRLRLLPDGLEYRPAKLHQLPHRGRAIPALRPGREMAGLQGARGRAELFRRPGGAEPPVAQPAGQAVAGPRRPRAARRAGRGGRASHARAGRGRVAGGVTRRFSGRLPCGVCSVCWCCWRRCRRVPIRRTSC